MTDEELQKITDKWKADGADVWCARGFAVCNGTHTVALEAHHNWLGYSADRVVVYEGLDKQRAKEEYERVFKFT